MKKLLLPGITSLICTLCYAGLFAQSTPLCDGVKYIYKNLTKNSFTHMPDNYAASIQGWSQVIKSSGVGEPYLYALTYAVKADEMNEVFKTMQDALVTCLGVEPKLEGQGPAAEATIRYKNSVILMYQRHTSNEHWIMLNISREE